MDCYYLDSQLQPQGPATLHQLLDLQAAGHINGGTLVAPVGSSQWEPLSQLLANARNPAPAPPVVTPPAPELPSSATVPAMGDPGPMATLPPQITPTGLQQPAGSFMALLKAHFIWLPAAAALVALLVVELTPKSTAEDEALEISKSRKPKASTVTAAPGLPGSPPATEPVTASPAPVVQPPAPAPVSSPPPAPAPAVAPSGQANQGLLDAFKSAMGAPTGSEAQQKLAEWYEFGYFCGQQARETFTEFGMQGATGQRALEEQLLTLGQPLGEISNEAMELCLKGYSDAMAGRAAEKMRGPATPAESVLPKTLQEFLPAIRR